MPIRSSGCFTCRKRKIRCDEGRPGCQRCATHGVPCPGYRTDKAGGLEFRDQTNDILKKVHAVAPKQRSTSPATSVINGLPHHHCPSNNNTPSSSDESEIMSLVQQWPGAPLLSMLALPPSPPSPGVHREQIYGNFLDIYLPKNSSRMDHFSFFRTIATRPTHQPALCDGLDALALATLGTQYRDRTLINQAVRSYGKALQNLAWAVARPENVADDELLAAVTIVGMCALYDDIGRHENGWGLHVNGCQRIMATRGPESMNSQLAYLLLANTRHGALCWSLIERKAPILAHPKWRAFARTTHMDSSTMFYDAALQIPGLLERYDRLGGEDALSLDNVLGILTECEAIEQALRDWFLDWEVRALVEGGPLYEEHPIEDFVTFSRMVKDRTIDTGYRFTGFPIAYLSSLYWMCMHFLRSLILTLHSLRRNLDEGWYPDAAQTVSEAELLSYVLNLCRCIPYFCEPESSNTGHVGIFLPMRTAAVYFVTRGHWRYVQWIGNVRMSVFTKGLSPPEIGDQLKLGRVDVIALRYHEKQFPLRAKFAAQSPSGFSSTSTATPPGS